MIGASNTTSDGKRPDDAQGYRIDFDMMVQGSTYKRRSGMVRQFGVTVEGATRLVTSGDVVDQPTYDALLAASAIRKPQPASIPEKAPASSDKKKAV